MPELEHVGREHTIEIEYCAPCNYLNLAVTLQADVLERWAPMIERFSVRPTAWGTFEVTLDGELIYSKWARGRHPKEGEVLQLLEQRLGPPFEGFADHGPEVVDAEGFPAGHSPALASKP